MAIDDGQLPDASQGQLDDLLEGQVETQNNVDEKSKKIENSQDELPSLDSQREIITEALRRDSEAAQEGDVVCVIPQRWYDKFLDENTTDPEEIGQLNPSLICRDYKNFILVEYDRHPYLSVSKSVFEKLVKWYGLAPRSQPVTTVLVHDDEANTLVTEYNRCHFRVHYLVEGYSERRYANNGPLYVTVSRLSNIENLYNSIVEIFKEKESSAIERLKVWYVKDSDANEKKSILLSSYKLNPLQFMQLPVKTQITSQLQSHSLKRLGLYSGDFVVEVKQHGQKYHWLSNYFIYNTLQPSQGITGLTNLGNTCYMNSALQCLVHIPELRDYFLYDGFTIEINSDNPLGYQGNIAKAFSLLVKSLFGASYGSASSQAFSPNNFKMIMGHCNTMFSGYMQQDSQEFLAFLLDGLHEDLNRVHDKPYIEKPSLSPNSDVTDRDTIKKLAEDTWKMHLLRNDSIVTDLFVALYESTLECPECRNVSITFDPYNDLTLPLPVNTTWHSKVKIFPQNSPPCILEVEMKKSASYQELKDYVAEYARIDSRYLYGCEIFNHQFCNNYESPDTMSQYLPISELISESDDVIFYELNASSDDTIVPVLNTRIEDNFNTPQLFGVPFFLVLSPAELHNPSLIRLKLERQYTHLSGGFLEFPLSSIEQPNDIESFSLLKTKYQENDLIAYQDLLAYAVPEDSNVNEFFSIGILQNHVVDIGPGSNPSGETSFWAPTSRLDYGRAKNLTEMLDNISRDIYDYPNFVHNIEAMNEPSNESSYMLHARRQSDDEKSDPDIDAEGDSRSLNDENIIVETDSNTDTGDRSLRNNIISPRDVIICEWSASRVGEVFNEDTQINWNKPAKLVNNEVEARKKEAEGQEKRAISLHDCLKLFSKKEVLSMNDSWYCPTCKDHRQATKQIQLWSTPDVLLIHLKRFENQRSFSDKIDDTVHFPIKSLDMTEHLVHEEPRGSIYDLIAVDNHFGGLGGGHYTAYVKTNDKWFYFDDSRVTETKPESSIAGSAYLLFYLRRTESGKIGSERLQSIILQSRKEHDFKIQQMLEQQKTIYATNKSDEEDLAEDDEDDQKGISGGSDDCIDHEANRSSSNENLLQSRSTDYSIASLEVGKEDSDSNEAPDDNLGRRKLRLLNKTYTERSETASPESSSSSDGAESISAVLTGSKINDESLPRSPEKQ